MGTTTTRLGLFKPDPNPTTGDDVDVSELNDNADKIDAAVGFFVCTSGTRPTTNAWQGMPIYETDTNRFYIAATGGPTPTWLQLAGQTGKMLANMTFQAGGDTNDRFRIDASTGILNWGSGTASTDTVLSRTAADELALAAGDRLRVGDGATGDVVTASNNGINGAAMASGNNTTTSSSYADWGGTTPLKSFSFTKRYASTYTRIKIDLAVTFYASTSEAGPMFGVNVNSTDYDVVQLSTANGTNGTRQFIAGSRYITGLPAGVYTVTGRWKRTSGTGTLERGPTDWTSLFATEVSV